MAYMMTSSETLINNEVQDIIDIYKGWGTFTSWATIRNGRDRQQVLKNHVNERLSGSKRDYIVATIDAMWSGWEGWKSNWKTVQSKFIDGLTRIQGVLASSPDVVTTVVREVVSNVPPAQQTPLDPPVTPPPNPTGGPRVPVTSDKIFGIPKKYVVVGSIAIPVVLIGSWALKKLKRE